MKPVDIDELVDGIVTLPTLPQNLDHITRLINDPDPSMSELGRAIAVDPAFALKTLRLVNSAFYGLRQEVTSVELAVTLLGLRVVRNLVVTALVCETLHDAERLLRHSVATALAARAVATPPRAGASVDPEEAFTCGLLHDVGRILIQTYLPDALDTIVALSQEQGLPFFEAERRVIGADHAEMGARLALRWKLPARVAGAIAAHHEPDRVADPGVRALAGVIAAADAIASFSGMASHTGPYAPPPPAAWEAASVAREDLYAVLDAFFGSLGSLNDIMSLAGT